MKKAYIATQCSWSSSCLQRVSWCGWNPVLIFICIFNTNILSVHFFSSPSENKRKLHETILCLKAGILTLKIYMRLLYGERSLQKSLWMMQELKTLCLKILIFPSGWGESIKKNQKKLSPETTSGQNIDFLSSKFSTGITLFGCMLYFCPWRITWE